MPRVIHFYRPKTRSVVVARIDELPNTYEGLSPEEVMEIQNGVQDLADGMFDNGFMYICEADVDGKEV